jgi:galactonate dehydratase
MRITDVRTYLVGNAWKNWLFVRVDTDEGIHGVGEGTLNAFSATVEAAIHELRDAYIGHDPSQVELLLQRMVRDVYTEGGQIHMAAVSAIEIACWDIIGKTQGRPVYELLGGLVRDRVPVYANGWYRAERTPEAFAERAAVTVGRGYRALKFDPFGAAWRVQDRVEEDRSIDIVAAVRDAVGPSVDLMIEGHERFSVSTALRIAERLAEFRPAWFEEPVHHQQLGAVVAVARRSPVPVATGESFTSLGQFADLSGQQAGDQLVKGHRTDSLSGVETMTVWP